MSHKRTTITVEQYETMRNWEPIVAAAGLLHPAHHPMHIYLLAGAIIRDEVVARRVSELPTEEGTAITPDGTTETVLRAMTDEERAALKARIVAKHKVSP